MFHYQEQRSGHNKTKQRNQIPEGPFHIRSFKSAQTKQFGDTIKHFFFIKIYISIPNHEDDVADMHVCQARFSMIIESN